MLKMLASMTAFQRETESGDWGSATIEIKTVNHRYLEMSIRLPDDLRALEPVFREEIQNRLSRGKVDCTVRLNLDSTGPEKLNLDIDLARKLIESAGTLPIESPQAINPMDILRWPGVISKEMIDIEKLTAPLRTLLNKTLDMLLETRRREGEKLKLTLLEKCNAISSQLEQTRVRLPEIITELKERYQQKAEELVAELDKDRLEQEILYITQKIDITEELERLDIHLNEVRRVLDLNEPIGRRLDFLMQELNREANTLASKSASSNTSNTSIELKVLIEQMREQVQNIE
jgi:uncharacterized protein (TIGR00255 family)